VVDRPGFDEMEKARLSAGFFVFSVNTQLTTRHWQRLWVLAAGKASAALTAVRAWGGGGKCSLRDN
jgi:hypothetical protein